MSISYQVEVHAFDDQFDEWFVVFGEGGLFGYASTTELFEVFDFEQLDAPPGLLYRWRVRAVEGAASSDWTNWQEAQTLLPDEIAFSFSEVAAALSEASTQKVASQSVNLEATTGLSAELIKIGNGVGINPNEPDQPGSYNLIGFLPFIPSAEQGTPAPAEPPTGIQGFVQDGTDILWSWDAAANATQYLIETRIAT